MPLHLRSLQDPNLLAFVLTRPSLLMRPAKHVVITARRNRSGVNLVLVCCTCCSADVCAVKLYQSLSLYGVGRGNHSHAKAHEHAARGDMANPPLSACTTAVKGGGRWENKVLRGARAVGVATSTTAIPQVLLSALHRWRSKPLDCQKAHAMLCLRESLALANTLDMPPTALHSRA